MPDTDLAPPLRRRGEPWHWSTRLGLAGLLALACGCVGVVALVLLYQTSFRTMSQTLEHDVAHEARLLSAFATSTEVDLVTGPVAGVFATQAAGEELLLATRRAGYWQVIAGPSGPLTPLPTSASAALDQVANGATGAVIATNRLGLPALTAAAPVAGTDLFVLGTITLAEFRRPFLAAALLAALCGLVLVLVGTLQMLQLVNPVVDQLTAAKQRLEAEVTERTRAEERWRKLLEVAPVGLLTADTSGLVTQANPAAEVTFGAAPDGLLGQRLEALLPTAATLSAVRAITARRLDGSPVPCEVTLVELGPGDGGVRIAAVLDLSRRIAAERARQQTESSWQAAFDHAAMGVATVATDGPVLSANAALAEIWGYSTEELLNQNVLEMTHPDDLAADIRQGAKVLAGERDRYTIEKRYRRGDDTWQWCRATISLVRDDAGEPLHFVAMIEDIAAERQRRAMVQLLHQAMESLSIAVYCPRADGTMLYVNPAGARSLGYSPEEVVNLRIWDISPSVTAESWPAIFERAIQAGQLRREVVHRRRDGSSFPVDLHTVVSDVWGEKLPVGFAVDITSTKAVEQVLTERESMLRAIFNQQAHFMALMDTDGRLLDVNQRGVEFHQQSVDAMRGLLLWEEPVWSQASVGTEAVRRYLAEAAAGHEAEFETEVRSPDGQLIRVAVNFTPATDDAGRVIAIIGTGYDITDRTDSLRQLELARAAAEDANQAKSRFLANMSHEIRTPLNAILGFCQLLQRDTATTARQQDYLTTIARSSEHLLQLVGQVLDLSKIEAGRAELDQHPFQLQLLLDDVEAMFAPRAADNQDLAFELKRAPELPGRCLGDEQKLRQVLINLLGNAFKFTRHGHIRLTVSGTQRNGQWHLLAAVEDTGCGIAPADLEAVFESFTQVHQASEFTEGTGLGLAISHHFVSLMGGELTVSSEPGIGSVFGFAVPLEVIGQGGPVETSPAAATKHPQGGIERVLVVDDEPVNRDLLVQLLQPLGWQITTAADGEEALEQAAQCQPQLVLMDIRMPRVDGLAATRRLKAGEAGPPPTVVVISAGAFQEDRELATAAGADGFVAKPFQLAALLDELAFVAQQASSPEPAPPLSHELAAELTTAARNGDVERLRWLLDDLAATDPRSAENLRRFVDQFDYEALIEHLGQEASSHHA